MIRRSCCVLFIVSTLTFSQSVDSQKLDSRLKALVWEPIAPVHAKMVVGDDISVIIKGEADRVRELILANGGTVGTVIRNITTAHLPFSETRGTSE
jgi:hypothetical protein